jgi:putative transposase
MSRVLRPLAHSLAADLSGLDLAAMMVDGVHFSERTTARSGSTSTARSTHCRWSTESTENATLVRDLLVGLRERGLDAKLIR